jgi:16S rRNA (cytidine1402-2'-O)-methyltransferase
MLYLVATPIGNLADISERALSVLREAHVLACEDTRRTRTLLAHFSIPVPQQMVSYREQTEQRMAGWLVQLARSGQNVVICSDGGYPGISDPGYRVASLAAEEKLEFHVIPGASAVDVALVSSGLPTSSWTFKGFPPRKPGALHRFFEEEKDREHTLVFFESPFRVAASLTVAHEVLGDRKAAVCIELTKKFERIHRGFLGDLKKELGAGPIKGEVTIVIAGANPKFEREAESIDPPTQE